MRASAIALIPGSSERRTSNMCTVEQFEFQNQDVSRVCRSHKFRLNIQQLHGVAGELPGERRHGRAQHVDTRQRHIGKARSHRQLARTVHGVPTPHSPKIIAMLVGRKREGAVEARRQR